MIPIVGIAARTSVAFYILVSAAAADAVGEVVVTATRVPQSTAESLEPIVVIDRAALENSLAVDVGDLLRFHAGLDIGRTGGPGQPLSLFIRGTNSNHAIVMIDGVRINPGTLGGAPLQNLAPELFERIEVIEGPRSTLYGTDAIGGVVNLITRSTGPSAADAMVGYGRYGTGQFALGGRYVAGEQSIQAALTGQRSNGLPTFAADSRDRGYQNLSGTVAAASKISAVDLGAFYWRSTGISEYANPNFDPMTFAFLGFLPASERFTNSALGAHASAKVTDLWHERLTLSRSVDVLDQKQGNPYNLNQAPDFDHTARNTLDIQNDVKVDGSRVSQAFTFGAILTDEQTDSLSFGTGYGLKTRTQTYYAQDQLIFGRQRLLLAGGTFHHPSFGQHGTWNAEYGYALNPVTLLIASAGTAFRAPSATDRFGYGGNPDLSPERSRNFELGLKSHLGEAQQVTVAAFEDTIDGLIDGVPIDSFGNTLNKNINRARIRGIEAGWSLRRPSWDAHAEASVQDPRDLSKNSTLLRRARQSLTFGGSRRVGQAEWGADLLQTGARTDGFGGVLRDGGYLLVAMYAKLSLSPAWSVTARLDNALDHRYQLANGYNTAGRSVSVAARYRCR